MRSRPRMAYEHPCQHEHGTSTDARRHEDGCQHEHERTREHGRPTRGRHEHEHGCEDGCERVALAKRLAMGPRYR